MPNGPSRHQRIVTLFNHVIDLGPDQQLAYLRAHCADDKDLLNEVLSLLDHAATSLPQLKLSTDVGGVSPAPASLILPKDTYIGPFRIVRLLGRGGMGEVYLAQQESPIRRDVALKLIRVGMNTPEVIARFEGERQAVALMDHPSIAKVFDAGTTEHGTPYFAMEYVPGLPISEYCDRHRLSTEERLVLFQRVCEGVQHAHQKAVIHRDLKPGNILVREIDGKHLPKIIDFGVAKAIEHHLTEETMFTQVGVFIGTPEYMSPEQSDLINHRNVDTQTDVYSLGVILYEIIVGVLPFEPKELRQAGFDGTPRVLSELDPPRPSTKLSRLGEKATEIAINRRTEPGRLVTRVRGELDWILMKSLEKDRSRRYVSPRELAADINRHLRNEPVLAGPPTAGYRVRKFVRRHRVPVAAVLAGVIMLTVFAIVTGLQAVRIAQERDRAIANELLALGRTYAEGDPTLAIAFTLASLERNDSAGAREFAAEVLSRHLIWHRLPMVGKKNPITTDVSPDGVYCAVGWSRGGITTLTTLEDLETRNLVAGGITVHNIRFTADSKYLATAALDSVVNVWRVEDACLIGSVKLPGICSNLVRLQDPLHIIVAAMSPWSHPRWFEITLPSLTTRELGKTLGVCGRDPWHGAAVDPAGHWIADWHDGTIVLQSLADLENGNVIEVEQQQGEICQLAFGPNGRWLASRDRAGVIRVWDLSRETPVLHRETHVSPECDRTDSILLFDPYRPRLLAVTGGRIFIWDLNSPNTELPLELVDRGNLLFWAAFHPDGSLFTCRGGYGVARWDIPDRRVREYEMRVATDASYGLSGDGNWLYSWYGRSLKACPIDSNTGADEDVIPVEPAAGWQPRVRKQGQPAPILSSRESWTGDVSAVDLSSGIYRQTKAHKAHTHRTNVSPSGRLLVTTGIDDHNSDQQALRIYDLMTDQVRLVEIETPNDLLIATFVADDSLSLLYSDRLALYVISDQTTQVVWHGMADPYKLADFDDAYALVNDQNILTLLDKRSGQERMVGNVPNPFILRVVYCEDYGLLAATGIDWPHVSLFALETGEAYRLRGHSVDHSVEQAFFDPQGRWLLTQGEVSLRKWPLPLQPDVEFMATEKLTTHLRSLTNMRVIFDESKPERYRLSCDY